MSNILDTFKKKEYNKGMQELSEVTKTFSRPEVDTIRIYWKVGLKMDMESFFKDHHNKYVCSVQRDFSGAITSEWEKFRNDMRCSWWGKMQITQEYYLGLPVLSIEFSVAKWWGITNAVNTFDGVDFNKIFQPIADVFAYLNIDAYFKGRGLAFEHFLKNCTLRRLDLSINFSVPPQYSTSDYIKYLSCVKFNRNDGKFFSKDKQNVQGSFESVSFGSPNTAYFVKFYDKYLEQKNYFKKKDVDNNLTFQRAKKIFWKLNGHLFQNTLRFEVEFRSKYFLDHKMSNSGVRDMKNVIDLCAIKWREILLQFDSAMCRSNLDVSKGKPLDQVLADLERMKESEVISERTFNVYQSFLISCYRKGADQVKKDVSRQTFSARKKWCIDNLNFDVTMLCPIMCIMRASTDFISSYDDKLKIELVPAPPVALTFVEAV